MTERLYHPFEAILRMTAQQAPDVWYPKRYAEATGETWDRLSAWLEILWLEGLIQRTGGTADDGPGFTLTETGQKVLGEPALLERLRTEGTVTPPGDRGGTVRQLFVRPGTTWVTRTLILANFLMFTWGIYLAERAGKTQAFLGGPSLANGRIDPVVLQLYHRNGAMNGDDLVRGETWRLVASGFVHAGLIHIVMNMVMLWAIGRQAEAMWGPWRMLALYMLGLLGGSWSSAAARPEVVGMGASGAVCGLLAAEAVWLLLNGRYLPRRLAARWRAGLLGSFLLLIFISLFPGVSGWGHGGGAAAGALGALGLNFHRFGPPRLRWLGLAGILIAGGLALVAMDLARTHNPRWGLVEVRDFLSQRRSPIEAIARDGQRTFQDQAGPLLNRRPDRRNADAVRVAEAALAQQRTRLAELRDSLDSRLPYRTEIGLQIRQATAEYLTAEHDLLSAALDCLQRGDDWTEADERAFVAQVRRATELRQDWRALGK